MFKENIMKKIAGVSLAAVVMMPGVVNAAATTSDYTPTGGSKITKGACAAANMSELKECMSKTGDFANVVKITFSGTNITEDITVSDYEIAGNVTVDAGKTLTLNGKAFITGDVEVDRGTLNIASKAATAISGALTVNKGVANINADNTNGNAASTENGATAVEGAVTVTAGTLNVTAGKLGSTVRVKENSTVKVQDVTGVVTIDGDGVTTFDGKIITGGLTLTGTSVVTVDAKEIKGTVSVNNAKATVKYVSDSVKDTDLTVTKGLVRKTNVVSATLSNVEVYAHGLSSVTLLDKNEVLVVKNVNDLGENFKLVGPNGSKIDNKSNTDLTITVNGTAAKVSKDAKGDDAYVVAGATEQQPPVQDPAQTEKPVTDGSGNVLPPKNPSTGDSVMSYVAVALTSVTSLGLAVKKFLF